ncbi:MAG: single-stranded DNA-binding protein, partial [Bacteroidales bacterium]|nr:single-stranded DNA-binding protein [Bacteroidales bacterium]
TLLTVEGYFKPEEWQDADGVKHNRVVLVATKFYEAVEKEETPAPQESKTKKGK